MTPDAPEILVLAEAAALMRVSESTLYDCIRNGDVPAFKLGRSWRFYRADLMSIRPADIETVEQDAGSAVRAVAGKRGRA